MNWRMASREELVNIAFIDDEAPLEYKIGAAEELKRRNRVKHGRMNNRLKVVYPK